MMHLGGRLRSERITKGLSQEELGKLVNKSKNNISQYELSKREPDNATLQLFAEIFGCSTDYLLGRTDVRSPESPKIETKAYHNIDTSGLTEEDIAYIDALIAGIKAKRKAEREVGCD